MPGHAQEASPRAHFSSLRWHQPYEWLPLFEALIQTKVAASPDLLAKVNRLQQVQGIGLLTATSLLALMPELGSLSDTQAAALAGVAPFNHDSCQFRGQRHIFGGRSQLRSVLYMAALVASRYNPILRPLYLRLLDRGKS